MPRFPVPGSLAVLAVAATLAFASPAQAATIHVPADYGTIQAAVNAATPGDTIAIAAGTYTGQVDVAKNLTITGAGAGSTTIEAPATPTFSFTADYFGTTYTFNPIVSVHGATVNVSGVTIDGAGLMGTSAWCDPGCGSRPAGIAFHNASGSIHDSTLTGLQDATIEAPTNINPIVYGVYVVGDDASSHSVSVANNTIGTYEKNGVVVYGTGVDADINGNTITGKGGSPEIAQNGIVVATGATATISANVVSGHQCDVAGACGSDPTTADQSDGVLLLGNGAVSLLGNTLSNNDAGIAVDGNGTTTATGNTISSNRYHGILALGNTGLASPGGGSLAFSANTISGGVDGFAVVDFGGGPVPTGSFTGNTVTGTSGAGVRFYDGGALSGPAIAVNFNRLPTSGVGVQNDTITSQDATNNWWGCNTGPGGAGCSTASGPLVSSPYLKLSASASQPRIRAATTSVITGELHHNSNGAVPVGNTLPEQTLAFSTTHGALDHATQLTSGLSASSTLSANNDPGLAVVSVALDNATVTLNVAIDLLEPNTTIDHTSLPGLNQDPTAQGAQTFATQSTSATFSWTSADPPFSANADPATNAYECRLDGGSWTACSPGQAYTNLAHGQHTFDVRSTDDVGNVESTPDTWTWFVDLHPPDVVPTYPYPNGRFSYYKDVLAQYTCDDHIGPPFPSESGVLTCLGQVPVGTPFDHTSQGQPASDHTFLTYPFSITRTDNVGNTTAAPFNYRVYTFAGLVLDDNPYGYWRMDDPAGSSTLSDFSGNGHDGEYKNGTASGPLGVSGDGNTARVFTGQDGYGFVQNMPAPQHGYTMAAFVQFADNSDGMIMQHGRAGALFRSGNSFVFEQSVHEQEVSVSVPGGIVPGCWYFVAGRYDGGNTATVYAGTHDNASGPDCTADGSDLRWYTPQSISAPIQPSGDGSTFYLGYGEEAPWLNGMLDEAAYFYTPISPVHIKELWLGDPPPPVSHVEQRYSAASSSAVVAAPSVTKTPAATPKKAASAKAKVAALSRKLAKARAKLQVLKRHHASRRAIRAQARAVARLSRQLAAAKRRS